MGRKLMRVPMDFDWPRGVVWKGYESPFRFQGCGCCEGTGYNAETKAISDAFHGKRSNDPNRWRDKLTQEEVDFLASGGHLWGLDIPAGQTITADECNEKVRCGGLPENDFTIRRILTRSRAERLGVYGECRFCRGSGQLQFPWFYRLLANLWKPKDPPWGHGYQLWETTSEGSPKSPVFGTLDELCEWAAVNATTFADFTATAAKWKAMLRVDFVHHRNGNWTFC